MPLLFMIKTLDSRLFWKILAIVLFITISLLSIHRSLVEKKIAKNHFVICGKILKITEGKSANLIIFYQYYYKDKIYKGSTGCKVVTKNKFEGGNDKIFVVVDSADIYNFAFLEDGKDFFKYKIKEKDTIGLECGY